MGRLTKSANEALREERKTQILEAALKVYIDAGFNGADMDEVARTAGLAKGLVYYYFPTKKELFRELFERCLERGIARERELVDSLAAVDPVERLLRYLWGLLKTAKAEPLLIRFAVRLPFDAYAVYGKDGWKGGARMAGLHQDSLTTLISVLKEAGQSSVSDPSVAAINLWAVIMANLFDFARMSAAGDGAGARAKPGTDRLRSMFAFCCGGLGVKESSWVPMFESLLENARKEPA